MHPTAFWLSMVSINQPGWFWSRHRQPGFCKQVVFLFLFFVLDFFIFFSACTCTVCVFLGFNRPAWLKPCARKEIILIWVSASATWILQTGRVLFFSFEIVLFSIFSVYCTFCILLVFNGLNRPGLKPYAGRDHPDFGLGIGNLDSATTRKICISSASNRISDILIFNCS